MKPAKNPELFYRKHVFCCVNKKEDKVASNCCYNKGSNELHKYMKQQCNNHGINDVRINKSGCLGRCKDGPILVIYPDSIWFMPKSKNDIDQIIKEYLL